MIIKKIEQEVYARYIVVESWSGVTATLNAYASGSAPSSHVAFQRTVHEMSDPSLFFLTPSIEPETQFVKRIVEEAQARIYDGREYKKDFDYDGMGTPFFKTQVTILPLADDRYGVGFYAVYTGDAPEKELAERCGLERSLIWAETRIVTEQERDRFVFDFEPVARAFGTLYDPCFSGEQIAQHLLACNPYEDAYITLHADNDLTTTLSLRSPGIVMQYKNPWKREESVLSGTWETRFGKEHLPTIAVQTRKTLAERTYDTAPSLLYRKEEKETLLARHNVIYNAIQTLC